MQWKSTDYGLTDLLSEIRAYSGSRAASPSNKALHLNVLDAHDLKADLAYSCGSALLVRQLLNRLGFDERRLFKYRLEHKLVQAQILNSYCPGTVPATFGAALELRDLTPQQQKAMVAEAYDAGFFLKAGLGSGSRDKAYSIDLRSRVEQLIDNSTLPGIDHNAAEEQFVFQHTVSIVAEYRVHSLEGMVIPALTFSRYLPQTTRRMDTNTPNCFVQEILNTLPDALVADSLYGWDVAIDRDGKPVVIELNLTGFHPIHRHGFQCSGFFNQPAWSMACLARLLAAASAGYDVSITIEAPPSLKDEYAVTYRLARAYYSSYRSLLSISRQLSGAPDLITYACEATNSLSREENALLWAAAEVGEIESLASHLRFALPTDEQPLSPVTPQTAASAASFAIATTERCLDGNNGLLSSTENALLALWMDFLHTRAITVDDSFLSLGGHSLIAIRLINQIRLQFSVDVSFAWFLSDTACIRELATLLDKTGGR